MNPLIAARQFTGIIDERKRDEHRQIERCQQPAKDPLAGHQRNQQGVQPQQPLRRPEHLQRRERDENDQAAPEELIELAYGRKQQDGDGRAKTPYPEHSCTRRIECPRVGKDVAVIDPDQFRRPLHLIGVRRHQPLGSVGYPGAPDNRDQRGGKPTNPMCYAFGRRPQPADDEWRKEDGKDLDRGCQPEGNTRYAVSLACKAGQ